MRTSLAASSPLSKAPLSVAVLRKSPHTNSPSPSAEGLVKDAPFGGVWQPQHTKASEGGGAQFDSCLYV